VTLPPTAITGPVLVQSNSQTSAAVILEVISAEPLMHLENTVSVGASSTTSGIDIYVPPAAGTLNVTTVGIGDPGATISIRASSVEVTRGQTKQLVVGGTAISQSDGTGVSISGGGITIIRTQFQSGYAFVDFTVAPTAETGPRNVIVTNGNMDISVLSGGLFVR
jgi:hypothetical protein